MRYLKNIFFVLVMVSLLVVPAMAKPIKIRFSHVVSPETPKGKAANYLKEILEERTGGKIKVEVYPNSSLYNDKEAIKALKMDVIQLACPSFSKFTAYVKQLQIFDLPFLFKSVDSLHKFQDSEYGKKMLKLVEKRGLVGLAYWDNGFKVLSNNVRPIVKPEDAKGIKFRIMSSKVLEEQFKALNAIPVTMSFSEVYTALQQGVVDGAENPWSNYYTKKFYEVQKYTTVSYHGYLGYMLVTNKKIVMKLKKAGLYDTFLKAVKDATEYERKLAKEMDDYYYKKVKESGKTQVIELTDAQKEPFRKLFKEKVYPKFYKIIGKDMIEAAASF
ncbi:DctP family TRAP transporter solute-binding subunit [Deferribacter abyssi]|uniref:DctP family TRAP transporter solute-binding subunit n=1 Tax=Deferribacter abyssi TaxID=213806 RepID=UPI003C1ACEC0